LVPSSLIGNISLPYRLYLNIPRRKIMAIWKNLTVLSLVGGVSLWLAGCTPAPPSSSNGSGTTTDSHEHGHEGHDHAHHGPHGGELMGIGNEEYHAEWKLEGDGKVTFYILDSAAKADVPIAAEKITIDTKVNDVEASYDLLAVNPSSDEMKTAQFEITDVQLEGVLESLSDKVIATLNVEINGTPYSQKIEKEAHDHGHDHAHGAEAKSGEPKPE
jgi:hypothetical protein